MGKSLLKRYLNFIIFFSLSSAFAAPTVLTYQGRIVKSDGTSLEHNAVSFLFQILDPTGACLVYQEQFSGYNMVNSKGIFDVPIGSGAVQFPNSGSFTTSDAFNNTSTFTCGTCSLSGATYNCSIGSGSYTPSVSDGRKLRVSFYDGSSWQTISPDLVIRSVPYASYASSSQKLGSYSPTDFIVKTGIPTCATGEFLTWNGSALACSAVTGLSGGTVTNVSSANSYLTVASATTTPVLTLNVGTSAGTVAAGNDSRIVNALQPTTAVGGDLTGTFSAPTVAKIQGVEVSSSAPASGHFLKFNGSNWASSAVAISDVTSLTSQLSGMMTQSSFNAMVASASCSTSQTMYWNSVSSTFSCQNIAFPSGSSQWTTTGSDVYYDTGNVGIGTTTPNYKLDVMGSVVSRSQSSWGSGATSEFRAVDPNGLLFSLGSDAGNSRVRLNTQYLSMPIVFSVANSEKMIINSSGNVGVGTTTPNHRIDVVGDVNVTGNFLVNGSPLTVADNSITTSKLFSNPGVNRIIATDGTTGSTLVPLVCSLGQILNWTANGWACANSSSSQWSSSGSDIYFNAGKVGIGVASPSAFLQVDGNGVIGYNNSNFVNTSNFVYGADNSLTNTNGGEASTIHVIGSSNSISTTLSNFSYNLNLFGRSNTVSNAGGSVILGSSNTVSAASSVTVGFGITNNIPASAQFGMSDTAKITILYDGNMGVGTTNPTARLDVAGEVKFGNTSSSCSSATEGQQRYNSTSKNMEFCNGTAWTAYGTGGGGGRTSCPSGYSLVGTSGSTEAYCISTSEETAGVWIDAVTNCANKSPAARLCTASEWAHACVKAGTYGISSMTGNWEIVADLSDTGAQVMGSTGCGVFAYINTSSSYGSRCCIR